MTAGIVIDCEMAAVVVGEQLGAVVRASSVVKLVGLK
jgi:hypothetical protein